MQWSLIFLSVIGLAVTSPVNPPIKESLSGGVGRNALLESQLRALLESLREMEELNPLEVDRIDITDNDVPLPGFALMILDAVVSELNTFVINELTISISSLIPIRYRASLDIHFPVLDVKADHYNIHVPLDGGMALFGNGDAKIDLIEPRITINLLVRPVFGFGTLHLTLEECVITVGLKAFESKITGLLGGDAAVDAFVNTFLSYLVPDLLITFENQITEIVSPIVMDIANDILSDFNVIDIIG